MVVLLAAEGRARVLVLVRGLVLVLVLVRGLKLKLTLAAETRRQPAPLPRYVAWHA